MLRDTGRETDSPVVRRVTDRDQCEVGNQRLELPAIRRSETTEVHRRKRKDNSEKEAGKESSHDNGRQL
jgi:endonuclease YncB( thermonuclease family)